jgi:predicted tellurium resistance membrane protein TerC
MAVDWVPSIIQIVLFNAVLSGDNAMVIALAAHRLPAAQRRQVML